ncbi:ferredoxin [Nocardioides zeae]|uniref:Ferredoxin n=1 Tax=Nocardioides imazamoxiresistens TaxID=3231893 RepID=A0ABU3PSH2_9ACTN|nr:ferredoxin [Nocardioides zeae]MDT9592144.1 ferredoxin [Nocardioides zeae]
MTAQQTETGLRYRIDTEFCAGHGRCYALDPDAFVSDDVGYGEVVDKVHPLSRRDEMESVAVACPEEAVTVVGSED